MSVETAILVSVAIGVQGWVCLTLVRVTQDIASIKTAIRAIEKGLGVDDE